jgi:hypothetical protein
MTDTTPPELSHAAVHIPVCGEEICSHTPQHIDIRLDRIVNPQDYYGLPQPTDNPESTQPDQMVEFVLVAELTDMDYPLARVNAARRLYWVPPRRTSSLRRPTPPRASPMR